MQEKQLFNAEEKARIGNRRELKALARKGASRISQRRRLKTRLKQADVTPLVEMPNSFRINMLNHRIKKAS